MPPDRRDQVQTDLGNIQCDFREVLPALNPPCIARIIYICYVLIYRASDDIRCFLQRPNIVASAISQFEAYILEYVTRAIGTDSI